jgi:hypothetical protein
MPLEARIIPIEQMREEKCSEGGKHKIWMNVLGDGHNYFCANGCKTYSDSELPEDL